MLGQLRAKLRELDLEASTDLIVVSDHAHSNVAGSSTLFPLRAIENGAVGAIDPNGYSVSGMIRLADLMHREGFAVFDGLGCSYLPVSMGVKADGTPVYPVLTDTDGKVCRQAGPEVQLASLQGAGSVAGEGHRDRRQRRQRLSLHSRSRRRYAARGGRVPTDAGRDRRHLRRCPVRRHPRHDTHEVHPRGELSRAQPRHYRQLRL